MQNRLSFVRLMIVAIVLMLMSVVATAQRSSPYIIVFSDDFRPGGGQASQFANAYGLEVSYMYRMALNGVAANVPEGRLNALRNDTRVAYVEPDLVMTTLVQDIPTGIDRSFASGNSNLSINGSDERVDVDVAVIDTGIDFEHPDLNVVSGTDCTLTSGGGPFASRYCGGPGEGTGGDDDQSHGTHVAGTIGALDNGIGVVGVAPGARLHAVKVLDSSGSGYTSGIIAGIEWVVAQGNIEVANMSLGGSGISTAYQDAIDNAVANGVVMVVAAGNSNADANNYSPAFVPSAITVSALADFDGVAGGFGSPTCRSDQDDTLADFSNWGSAVDIAAPGVCILSTYPIEMGEYASISGTSMAAPHVAGAAALLASGANSPQNATDVQAIRDTLVNTGNFNWIDDSGDGIKESLLDLSNTTTYNPSFVGGGGGTTNTPPTSSFTFSCTDLTCSFDGTGSSDSDGSLVGYAWDLGDGTTATGSTVSYTYAAGGNYGVSLTVTDDAGASDSSSQTVSVSETVSNEAPTAAFTFSCTDLACSFDGTNSFDNDGNITSYAWSFGDGASASGSTTSHTYAVDGSYTATLTVTDDAGATDSISQTVSVTASSGGTASTISVSDLDGVANSSGRDWSATVTVKVSDNTGAAVSGASVSGDFSNGAGSGSCVTGTDGTCTIPSDRIRKGGNNSMTFTVMSVSGNLTYDPNGNSDPDGDSNGTSITIFR
jgi:subtilisin